MTWIITHTGHKFHLTEDKMGNNPIHVEDIATALAKQCRFNGHSQGFYSVAEHSVRVSTEVPHNLAFVALLHDAAEAYVGDLVSPVKRQCPEFERIEKLVQCRILDALGVPHHYMTGHERMLIKEADQLALAIEMQEFWGLGNLPEWAQDMLLRKGRTGPPNGVMCLDWQAARLAFIERFNQLNPFPEAA